MHRLVATSLHASILALTLQACSTSSTPHEGTLAWRRATIVKVGPADALGPPLSHDCRPVRSSQQDDDAASFAVVQYVSGRTSVVQIVRLEPGYAPAVGDRVEIGRFGCRDARSPRPG